jgi:hypothetical protein
MWNAKMAAKFVNNATRQYSGSQAIMNRLSTMLGYENELW